MGRQPRHRQSVTGAGRPLMRLQWNSKALFDLMRLNEFFAGLNKPAAARVAES